ncbi:prolyl oligopeptidase family serine peptidase [Actinorugispora endophytica]|uniref:Prolyl oligopeptidase n=1 Tax=Actinorugispora endophytica TaxID=1605990 RepID=A0A4R6UL67_9ACTN|nr:prolyl oligopeptidase family serine peptidase [Actinorugispora endophytica]TDQ45875.1 prolyl oligopeptidase [Actinorugispora endophytica]
MPSDPSLLVHPGTVPDPYRWLERDDSAETIRWLAERDTEFRTAALAWRLRDALAADIRSLVSTVLWSMPVRRAGLVFATRRGDGDEHPRLVVVEDGRERVLFDPLTHDPGGTTTLDAWEPSPDGLLVAVQTSSGGTERGALRVLSTTTGLPVERAVEGVRYTHVAWLPAALGAAFYFVRRDDGDGRRGVWLHRVGLPAVPDALVHPCATGRTVPGVRLRRGRWLLVSESHGTGHRNDLWIADLAGASPEAPELRPVHVGRDIESEADLGPDGLLYLRTTHGAPLRRVCAVDPAAPAPERWHEVVSEDPEATLDGFAVSGAPNAVEILTARTRLGVSELHSHTPARPRAPRAVPLPGEGMVTRLETDEDDRIRFCYADVATQLVVFEHRPGGAPERWPDPSGPAPEPVRVERRTLWSTSFDGTPVPVTLFALPGSAPGPTILHAYGGFGRPRQFGFSATVLAWLRAGGRYAVAHVRGGGDRGRAWHLAGAGRNKVRAVRDLVAAADTLVADGECARGQLCLSGGSTGGLLVLAAVARRPDLCAAVIASAPLADMVRFERLGLGAMWTREFGTAAEPDDLTALLDYSPYHRVLRGDPGPYPAVLLTGFGGDTRTDAAHPRKMCAALLERAAGPLPVLLRYEHGVGHGPRSVTRAIELAADAHAFAAAQTGLTPVRL